MEQRRLRLGDILDDYCPRERRVTNHAVVALVEDGVKQTRCTTCDAEHVYKGAKAPRRKKAETTGKLYKQVLAGLTDGTAADAAAASTDSSDPEAELEPIDATVVAAIVDDDHPLFAGDEVEDAIDADDVDDGEGQPPLLDDGPVHRPLIRAQLPRVEGVKLERQAPDFTIRQASGRGNNNFRGGQPHSNNNAQRFSGRGGPHRGGSGGPGGGRGGRDGGRDANQGFGRGPGPRKRGR